jgi:uncharacterized protein YihD (DUF1040 family)
MAAMLKEAKKVNIPKIKKEYERNEDENRHIENYLLLAKTWGTKAQVKKVKEIQKRQEADGYANAMDNKWLYTHVMPYYRNIRNYFMGQKS